MRDAMREQFEAWAQSKGMLISYCGVFTDYAPIQTQAAWEAWQASREAVVVELPVPEGRNLVDCDAVQDAIEAQGLRVQS